MEYVKKSKTDFDFFPQYKSTQLGFKLTFDFEMLRFDSRTDQRTYLTSRAKVTLNDGSCSFVSTFQSSSPSFCLAELQINLSNKQNDNI